MDGRQAAERSQANFGAPQGSPRRQPNGATGL
ncbi:MAG: hypothetical protein K0R39_2534 [Symbiobacteriaceae bacterium]|jgi:hypothetical protein|nr:hypothetical protein [Symbiobacteriaceae bacterium]